MAILVLYHGTTPSIASSLRSGQIQIALGGGEFGRGFYMGTSKRLAKRRGYHKTFSKTGTASVAMAMQANTLVVTLDEAKHQGVYRCRNLDLRQSIGLYGSVRKHRTFVTYMDGHDAIVGAIVGNSRYHNVTQYKFQSSRAETILNVGCPHDSITSKAIV
jgi:hypothetical protein